MWWTADPPRPFQLRPVPICSALRFLVAGLLPAFLYRRFHVYLKESRIPLESPLWYDRFSWQNPVRVTRPVPPGRCPVTFHPLCFQTGRSFSRFALVQSPSFDFFRSSGFLRSCDRFHLSDFARSYDRLQSSGFLQSCDCFKPLPSSPASRPFPTSSIFVGLTTASDFSTISGFSSDPDLTIFFGLLTAPFSLRLQPFSWWASL